MPLDSLPNFPWPIEDEEIRLALEAAYRDGSWGQYHGPYCAELIEELQRYFGCEHVQLCSSGTIGVELALRGCGVGAGNRVAMAGYDFAGNFRAIDAVGARAVLVDVARDTWCLDANSLAMVDPSEISAVIVSHLHGGLADMPRIVALAREHNWHIVEDACQVPGASLQDRKAGTWGDVGVLSFGGSKLLTSGRGGAVLTDSPTILQRMKVFSEQGNQAFPLSELQAAVLRPQLDKLDERNAERREKVEILRENNADLAEILRPISKCDGGENVFYKFAWSYLPAEEQPEKRDKLLHRLAARNVPIDAGFRGFVKRSAKRCEKPVPLLVSEALSQSTLLLHHPILLAHKKAVQQLATLLDHEVKQLAN